MKDLGKFRIVAALILQKLIWIAVLFGTACNLISAEFKHQIWQGSITYTNGFDLKYRIAGFWADLERGQIRPVPASNKIWNEPIANFLNEYYLAFASGSTNQMGRVIIETPEIQLSKLCEVKDSGPDECTVLRALRFGRWDFVGMETDVKQFRNSDGSQGMRSFTYMELARKDRDYKFDLNMGKSPLNLYLGAIRSPKLSKGEWISDREAIKNADRFWTVTNLAEPLILPKNQGGEVVVGLSGYQTNRALGDFTVRELARPESVENAWASWMLALRDESRRKFSSFVDPNERSGRLSQQIRSQSTLDFVLSLYSEGSSFHLDDEYYLHGVIEAGEYQAVVYSKRKRFQPFDREMGCWLWFHRVSGKWHVTDYPVAKMTVYELLYFVCGINGHFAQDPAVTPQN